jgi:hypothetical protein
MAASTSDKLTNTASTTTARPQPTQVTSTRSAGVFTLSCNALTGWPTDTKVHFCTYKLNTAGAKIVGSQIDMDGIVSGTSIGSITIRGGTDVGNAISDIVEMAPTAAWGYDLNKWGTVHADAQGNLLTAAVQAALGLTSLNGYTPLGATPNTVTYNGNRSYDLVFNSTDLTGVLSNGMRLRTTRTVTAPTQCTSLNGTTQYYSKTSPAGMSFTDDFVAGGWVKLSSYPATEAAIIGRCDATPANGWFLAITSTGQVYLRGYNAGNANTNQVISYQSVPLNKWVHITAQLDMSTAGVSTTTSYIMFDGVDVPCQKQTSGTAPTSLVNTGNFAVGTYGSLTSATFPGKIAQAFVTSAKVTQATIRSNYISQSISPTETSLISAYSFNNSINDLNTTNANNLTANGSAVATNADSPFTQDDTGTPGGSNDYAIVTKKVFSTNTTITVQVPEGCTIPTSGGVSAVVYSSNKVPYGFPSSRGKWGLSFYNLASVSNPSASAGTWYNTGHSLQIPVGDWIVGYRGYFVATSGGTTYLGVASTLSTANNTQSDIRFTAKTSAIASSQVQNGSYNNAEDSISLSSATSYYLNLSPGNGSGIGILWQGNEGTIKIYAEPAYL